MYLVGTLCWINFRESHTLKFFPTSSICPPSQTLIRSISKNEHIVRLKMDKNSEINFECGYLYDLPKANSLASLNCTFRLIIARSLWSYCSIHTWGGHPPFSRIVEKSSLLFLLFNMHSTNSNGRNIAIFTTHSARKKDSHDQISGSFDTKTNISSLYNLSSTMYWVRQSIPITEHRKKVNISA